MRRRTKIVCTIGPATDSAEQMRALLMAGMNVARLNFSHGEHDEHRARFMRLRAIAAEQDSNLAIMMDLQGPKIRTGPMKDGAGVELTEGAPITLTTRPVLGGANEISTSYAHLPGDVRPGNRILIADGLIELQVLRVAPPDVHCKVLRGGLLGQFKGINLPGANIREPALTEKDREDLAFGLELGVDYVALSFVRAPEDLDAINGIIQEAGASARVIAKIERPEAVERFQEIALRCDGVMIARGDLGVEIAYEEVPEVQKRLIQACNEIGIPVITATQMLESMVQHPRPTRAEVADVANAIFDGSDAVMLSAESAAGSHPIEACAAMARIAFTADAEMMRAPPAERWVRLRTADHQPGVNRRVPQAVRQNSFADAIGQAVCRMAASLRLERIVCFTRTGYTAQAIARYRPGTRITAITDSEATWRALALLWGVQAHLTEDVSGVDDLVRVVDRIVLDQGLARMGDTIIIVAGAPLAAGGRTNLLKLHIVGEE